jgi:hypothetical protein
LTPCHYKEVVFIGDCHRTKHIMEGGMTQLKHRALTSAITALSLAIVAASLTIDQRGSVGISQALAKGGHGGHALLAPDLARVRPTM